LAERTITWARRLGDVLTKKPERRTGEESARVVHAVRMARRVVRDRTAVLKLFDELAPRYLGRYGGYTRIVKIGQRPGDAAPMSYLELIPDDAAGAGKRDDAGETKKAKGTPGGRDEAKKAGPAKKGSATESAKVKAKAAEGDAAADPQKSKAKPKAKKQEE
jgi:large subunit ribosomal protein L17